MKSEDSFSKTPSALIERLMNFTGRNFFFCSTIIDLIIIIIIIIILIIIIIINMVVRVDKCSTFGIKKSFIKICPVPAEAFDQ
jgi:competence protein ComGC